MNTARFATRARREAARYGGDPWVFVRELVQNARDAGATRIEFRVERSDGFERITCRDDGHGMTLGHARRFLFTLYASSKRGSADAAGTFGVGFWSVLRFDPTRVVVRSRVAGGAGWQATVEADLDRLHTGPWDGEGSGTEIVLVRGETGADLRSHLADAVRREAPFVRRRDRPGEPLVVTVDGVPVTTAPRLDPPSVEFESRGVRGAVGLGETPWVVLYAHGLRVREAATLDELVEGTGETHAPDRGGSPPGLAGRALVDADGLELLAARGDARSDRELRRVVRTARRELDRLVSVQLDEIAPLGLTGRMAWWWGRAGRWIGPVLGATAVALTVAATVWMRTPPAGSVAAPPVGASTAVSPPVGSRSIGLAELDSGYGGPTAGVTDVTASLELSYAPADRRPWLAVLRRVTPDRRTEDGPLRPDDGPRCRDGCLAMWTRVGSVGVTRLPEPTGWRVDPASVRLDGQPLLLWRTDTGEAVVTVPRADGRLEWRAGPGAGPGLRTAPDWPALPPPAAGVAAAVAGRPVDEAADVLATWVRQRVRYDRSPQLGARHAVLAASGVPLFNRILELGAGDCDLQNALLAAMFDRAGIASRLAVGTLGIDGRSADGLHAWVEVRAADGRWRVVDASTPRPGVPTVAADPRPSRIRTGTVGGPVHVSPSRRPSWWFIAVAGGALSIGAAAAWALRRGLRRSAGPSARLDPATVIRVALDRPAALGPRAALERRPLVPAFGGRRVSVARARVLAARRELVACRDHDRWRELVGPDGPVTVDLVDPAGRELSAALHLPVVDDWAGAVDHVEETRLTSTIERALRAEGVRWTVRAVPEAPEAAMAARGWRALETEGRRVVLVRTPSGRSDVPSEMLDRARSVADAIGLSEPVSRRVLRRQARDLLRRGAR